MQQIVVFAAQFEVDSEEKTPNFLHTIQIKTLNLKFESFLLYQMTFRRLKSELNLTVIISKVSSNLKSHRYNIHPSTRSAIKRASGLLKRRFSILHSGLRMNLNNVPNVIMALCCTIWTEISVCPTFLTKPLQSSFLIQLLLHLLNPVCQVNSQKQWSQTHSRMSHFISTVFLFAFIDRCYVNYVMFMNLAADYVYHQISRLFVRNINHIVPFLPSCTIPCA